MTSAAMAKVVQVTSSTCEVYFDGSETVGGDVSVRVSVDSFSDLVPFRVWFPDLSSVQVHATDVLLSGVANGCDAWSYQRTTLSASASFQASASVSGLTLLDITPHVSFCTTDDTAENVVNINGTTLLGVGPGVADVTVCTANAVVSTAAATEVVVSSTDTVDVVGVESVVLNGVELDTSNYDDSASFMVSYSFDVSARGVLSLTTEGDEALGFAFAVFSDGTSWLLESGVNASTLRADVVAVSNQTTPAQLVVPVGATSGNGTDIMELSWSPCVMDTSVDLVVSYPWVTVEMPAVTDVTVTIDNSVVYFADDPLATLDEAATSATLSVLLSYEDGSERNMETDFRTVFSPQYDVVSMTGNVATATAAATADVEISVSFGSYTDMTSVTVVTVAEMADLTLASAAFPSCTLDGCAGKTEFSPIQTTDGPYQRVKLSATATDSVDTVFDLALDSDVRMVFSDTAVVAGVTSGACDSGTGECAVSNGRLSNGLIVGAGSGSASVQLNWHDYTSAITFTVVDEPAVVTDVSIVSPSTAYIETLDGEDTVMRLSTTFSDDTSFTAVKSDGSNNPSSWVSLDQYLVFESSAPDVLSVDETGTLTLWNNSKADDQVVVMVASSTDSSINDDAAFYGNLEPGCFDVDIGATMSQPLPSYAVGDEFDVPIRINTCGDALTAFQVQIFFDSDVVVAVQGEQQDGANWPGAITYTFGSPSSMVQILSSEPTSTASGSSLVLATIRFEVIGDGATWFQGIVVDTLTSGGEGMGETNRAMVAGRAVFESADARRVRSRRLQRDDSWPPQKNTNVAAAHARLLRRGLAEQSLLRGDTNGDGLFTVSDLDFIKRFYVGDSLEFVDEDAQVREMDADLDGEVDTLDIVYINSALAKKFRFLLNTTRNIVGIVQTGCTVTVSATLVTDTGELVTDASTTELFLVLGDVDGSDVDVVAGRFVESGSDGAVLQAADPQEGVFETSFAFGAGALPSACLLYTSPSPRDRG